MDLIAHLGNEPKKIVDEIKCVKLTEVILPKKKVAASGYRLIINCNSDGGQGVFYLHMHILGGRKLGAMVSR